MKKKTISVQGFDIRVESINNEEYISLTDIAKKATNGRPAFSIASWLRNANTIRFLYTWETLNNPNVKVVQMHYLTDKGSDNRFIMSPKKWIELVNAIGITSTAGRYGGTYAHKTIALNFCYWLSPVFQVYLIQEFQRLKVDEAKRQKLEWDVKKITDNIEEIRNILDTIDGQNPTRNRLLLSEEE